MASNEPERRDSVPTTAEAVPATWPIASMASAFPVGMNTLTIAKARLDRTAGGSIRSGPP